MSTTTLLVSEAAETLEVSRQRIHFLIKRGDLRGSKVGGIWVIEKSSVKNWKPGGPGGRPKRPKASKAQGKK